jgi:hypothetical protein
MQEACKARRALDQRWLALLTFALGICRSVGRDAECSDKCIVQTCFLRAPEIDKSKRVLSSAESSSAHRSRA